MNRRELIGAFAAGGLAAGCAPSAEKSSQEESPTLITELAGMPLADLRDLYRHDLFDDYLPFEVEHVVDKEYGGFMCNTDRAGNNLSTVKNTWFEGRGIWVHSFLFNHWGREADLDIARKSVELTLPLRPAPGKLWPGAMTREGKPTGHRESDIYCGLFVANGLNQFAQASGESKYRDLAKEILLDHLAIYDDPGYQYPATYAPDGLPKIQGPRVLGHWMVLLRLATQMLEVAPDPEIEEIARRSVAALLDQHQNPEFDLMNEVLNHDLSRPGDGWDQFCYIGHAIETLWMVMFEAGRLKDKALYERAATMFKRHVEVAWDDVYGGFFHGIDNVNQNVWQDGKVLWLQEEVLVGTLYMIHHTGDPWAVAWFNKHYAYVREKWPLAQYGYPIWILSADRKVTFEEKATRVGNFHHPRHLMINLLMLNDMVERKGAPTGLFA
ncbi:MAG: hypothetical protein GC160_30060 [Acidobacteria bacterium]|nr:hypothetical protein [Acidobacteriota bacterium]